MVGIMPVASMPMYDIPEVRGALDALWRGFARHARAEGLADVPDAMVHGKNSIDLWDDPDLWLSQCCGYDIVNRYAGRLRQVATPHYGALQCRGSDYTSLVIVGEGVEGDDVLEMRGRVCVVNGMESHSGMSALRALVAPRNQGGRFFSRVLVSGSHVASLALLRNGKADVTAIDCVTYALLDAYRPVALTGTRVLGTTDWAPGIPYVTRTTMNEAKVARMEAAIYRVFADPHLATARHNLYLKDIATLGPDAYQRIRDFQDLAVCHGFPVLQ